MQCTLIDWLGPMSFRGHGFKLGLDEKICWLLPMHAMGLNAQTGTDGSPVSSKISDSW